MAITKSTFHSFGNNEISSFGRVSKKLLIPARIVPFGTRFLTTLPMFHAYVTIYAKVYYYNNNNILPYCIVAKVKRGDIFPILSLFRNFMKMFLLINNILSR